MASRAFMLVAGSLSIKNIPELSQKEDKQLDNYEMAPDKIILTKEEMFTDNNGNVLDIDVRGKREFDKCYFRVKDVMEGFEMNKLNRVLADDRNSYKENIDYKYFYCKNVLKTQKINKKELYLTYTGLLRVLFVSRSGRADKFVKWAAETLFTAQMGTIEQKTKLAKSLVGISYSDAKTVFDTHTNDLSCVYLVVLNSVKNLRDSMNIDPKHSDDKYVCKYGFSKDFKKRMETHKQEYKHIKNVNLSLKNISLIDPKYISNAEKDIKEIVPKYSFQFEKFDELIILDKKDFSELEKYYNILSHKYKGYNENLNTMITELKLSIRDTEHKIEIERNKHVIEIIQKDRELDQEKANVREEKLKYESLMKDVKILEMEKQLLLAQHNFVQDVPKKVTQKKK